jgi:hypothetical protein
MRAVTEEVVAKASNRQECPSMVRWSNFSGDYAVKE